MWAKSVAWRMLWPICQMLPMPWRNLPRKTMQGVLFIHLMVSWSLTLPSPWNSDIRLLSWTGRGWCWPTHSAREGRKLLGRCSCSCWPKPCGCIMCLSNCDACCWHKRCCRTAWLDSQGVVEVVGRVIPTRAACQGKEQALICWANFSDSLHMQPSYNVCIPGGSDASPRAGLACNSQMKRNLSGWHACIQNAAYSVLMAIYLCRLPP